MTTTTAVPRIDRYFVATAGAEVAQFVARVANHQAKLALHRIDPTTKFPMGPSKNAKHKAYASAARVATLLNKHQGPCTATIAHDVPGLAAVAAEAIAFVNATVDAEAVAAAEAELAAKVA